MCEYVLKTIYLYRCNEFHIPDSIIDLEYKTAI